VTTTSEPAIVLPTVDAARILAADLIRTLARHIGDETAAKEAMRRWADTLGPAAFGCVSMAALLELFVECLHVSDPVPLDATTFAAPEETP
jgi:hypothetical protein